MKKAIVAGVCGLLVGGSALAQEGVRVSYDGVPLSFALKDYAKYTGKRVEIVQNVNAVVTLTADNVTQEELATLIEVELKKLNIGLFPIASNRVVAAWINPSVAPPPAAELSYAERLRRRQEAREIRQAALAPGSNPPPTGEKLEKQLREYNMNLIRAKEKYGPPVPIPLTEEEDAQLVKEGVLPPREKTPTPPGTASTNRAESVREPAKP